MRRALPSAGLISPSWHGRFYDPNRVVHTDNRRSYGEERYQLMGMIEQRSFVVVYTPRHGAMRIISARKANQREVRHYEDSTHDD